MGRLNARDQATRAERELESGRAADYSDALDRGLRVLGAFSSVNQRLSQADLARMLDLPRATVRRSLLTLQHMGFVALDGRVYRLTPQVLTLASAYLTSNSVSPALQPVCERLSERFGASSAVAALDGFEAVMIARAVPRQSIALGHGVGFRVPVATSALGRVLLASLDPARRGAHLVPGIDAAVLDDALAQVAAAGYAFVSNDVEVGFQSVAVPLRRWDGAAVAALNVGARQEQLTRDDMLNSVLPALRDAAKELSSQLV
jgi:IclR family pca regulon transcriptional regulator